MNAIVTQMIILFILVVVGYIISKKKMMDADFDRKLSVFVINVACPCLILSSVMGDTLPDKHFIIPLLIVGFATYVILIGAGFLLPHYLPIKATDRKHSIFRHDNFIGCFSADKIKMSARKYFCFNIPIDKNMAEGLFCRSPYHEEYIQTSASGNPEDLCH